MSHHLVRVLYKLLQNNPKRKWGDGTFPYKTLRKHVGRKARTQEPLDVFYLRDTSTGSSYSASWIVGQFEEKGEEIEFIVNAESSVESSDHKVRTLMMKEDGRIVDEHDRLFSHEKITFKKDAPW